MITLAKIPFLLILKLIMQIFPKDFLFPTYDVSNLFTNIPLQETIDMAINRIFNPNPNLSINRKELKKLSISLHHRLISFLTVSFLIKSME